MTNTQIKKELRGTLKGLNSTAELILKKLNYTKEERAITFEGIEVFRLNSIINHTALSTVFIDDILSAEVGVETLSQITNIIRKDYHALNIIKGLSRNLRENLKDENSRITQDIILYTSLRNFGA